MRDGAAALAASDASHDPLPLRWPELSWTVPATRLLAGGRGPIRSPATLTSKTRL